MKEVNIVLSPENEILDEGLQGLSEKISKAALAQTLDGITELYTVENYMDVLSSLLLDFVCKELSTEASGSFFSNVTDTEETRLFSQALLDSFAKAAGVASYELDFDRYKSDLEKEDEEAAAEREADEAAAEREADE